MTQIQYKRGDQVVLARAADLGDQKARNGDICTVTVFEALDNWVQLTRNSDGYAFGCYARRIDKVRETAASRLGYKVGDKFTIIEEHSTFSKGAVVTLYRDDGSSAPLFSGDSKDTMYTCADGKPGAYVSLHKLVKLSPNGAAERVRAASAKLREAQAELDVALAQLTKGA